MKDTMAYEGRALYNLLQMNFKKHLPMELEKWQVENYRELSQNELFERLEKEEISLNEESFLLYVGEYDSPEGLTECLYMEDDDQKHDRIYLCVFELWRRLAPHKQSISLFVDELDHLIEQYEEGNLETEDELQAALTVFQAVLDGNVDEGGDAKNGYYFLSTFSCHDLETFIYGYISYLVDTENNTLASEMLEGFDPYVDSKRWFDLIRVRLVIAADPEEGKIMFDRLLVSVKEEPELYLLFEMLHYLIHVGETEQFQTAYMQALNEVKTQGDLQELLFLTAEYFNAIEKEEEEALVSNILEELKEKDLEEEVGSDKEVLRTLRSIVTLSLAQG